MLWNRATAELYDFLIFDIRFHLRLRQITIGSPSEILQTLLIFKSFESVVSFMD